MKKNHISPQLKDSTSQLSPPQPGSDTADVKNLPSQKRRDLRSREFQTSKLPLPRLDQGLPSSFLNPPASLNGPLEVEIGCGVGHHPEARARSLPAHRVVAIEHTREKFGKFQRRLQDLGCPPNLHVVHANAISWVTHFLQPHQVDRYFLLYPNPHPKTRDRGQRWHQMSFFEQLLKTLKPGGELVLATNLEWYASEAVAWICDHWGMRLLEKRSLSAELSPELVTQARTLFERKYLERGEICWNLVFQKPL